MNPELIEHEANELSSSPSANVEVAMSRAAQEVAAAMGVAKKFPRDETAAYKRLMTACKRKGLAEAAVYVYPRGGEKVQGPSIRLAEAAAQCWGNLDFGVVELEQKAGESHVMAYCWDLETNTRQTKIFTVRHERHTKKGRQFLSDPRDIYEMVANNGARRLRACILGVIPGDVIDDAVGQCEKTMQGNTAEPLADRVRKMVLVFGEYGITQEMIEARLGHKIDSTGEPEVVTLRKIFVSLKDGMSKVEDWFSRNDQPANGNGNGQASTLAGASKSEQLAAELAARKSPEKAVEKPTEQPKQEAPAETTEKPAQKPKEPRGEVANWAAKIAAAKTVVELTDLNGMLRADPSLHPLKVAEIELLFVKRSEELNK